ncbi:MULTISPECIES: DNA-3-methyladenine glycosylase I [unclassified Paracoccus (in: a-proteobacteria)]|uniref:DNA-3-methyladenine glycosylase I n=1 Tax=unclassified Paracoccus (in: a-proteobacteria) TaxID=2688777 RepID=UPI0012B3DF21|nr:MULTISPECIES: DNA-3-methyladenine glycosylase I [unclassified Paracoccus (in: a-proteobacteria)]UXU75064.1 DNA-3-methyladenine glycosylase I [Paracoccus sp. SMMA_5]UXU80967.1 DNA-3-methyladenine glycosylase I [Paracoccus sp. SMMA_5_TC]
MPETTQRCPWCGTDPLYVAYHDHEWGVPERDSRALWEKLVLDGFQAGLSWITILRKRDAFRAAFDGFDPERVAAWDEARVAATLADPGIIRHRGKIEATVRSARLYLQIEADEGFADFIWSFVDGQTIQNDFAAMAQVPASTPQSQAMAKALKQRGFNFCGPVITYAFMQACGLVNDHLTSCPAHGRLRGQ